MGIINKIFQRKIIILVHGLANKPSSRLLQKWAKKSIKEGFSYVNAPVKFFRMESSYWADLMHEKPQSFGEKDENSECFLDDPYIKGDTSAYKNFKPSGLKMKLWDKLEDKIDEMFFKENGLIKLDFISDVVIRNLLKDLDHYWRRKCPVLKYSNLEARDAIRDRLIAILKKHRNKKIMLIGHSMGSIIAYDVMVKSLPDIGIHTFITIGSPLGLPMIMKKNMEEMGKEFRKGAMVPSPENITGRWYNFADLNDPVALNYSLANDYEKNSKGLGPEDIVVYNNYEKDGRRHPHKLYGYLRAPEVSRVIYQFLKL
ncbi:MAG: GPI inositol-deacylase [Spirochaetes bacterium]|jgi:hypothetical protein|nr:GPI inositol-deacylase [Spirochaetota bacterium]